MLTPASSTAELDRLGDEIAELSVHLDAAIARLLDLIREFDGRGGWGNGFRSCAHWLSWRVGLDIGAAREKVRVARALGTLPRLAHALARGLLSSAKVRALTRAAPPATEERLLEAGRSATAEHVERSVRGARRHDAGRPGRGSTVGAWERRTDFRGNVPAPGVRRQPRGDAARPGRPRGGGRGANADDSASATPRAPASRPRLSFSGLSRALRTGASHSPLGSGRAYDALEPLHALPAPPSCRSRGGLSGRSRA